MMELEALYQDAKQFLQQAQSPMDPRTFRDQVSTMETYIAALSNKVMAQQIRLALEPVARWDYLDSNNSVVMKNIFLPEIKRFVAVIEAQFQWEETKPSVELPDLCVVDPAER